MTSGVSKIVHIDKHDFRVLCKSCLEVDRVTITVIDGVETTTCECGNTETRVLVSEGKP